MSPSRRSEQSADVVRYSVSASRRHDGRDDISSSVSQSNEGYSSEGVAYLEALADKLNRGCDVLVDERTDKFEYEEKGDQDEGDHCDEAAIESA